MAETKMKNESLFSALRREKEQLEETAVSYTHLTLPTIA